MRMSTKTEACRYDGVVLSSREHAAGREAVLVSGKG